MVPFGDAALRRRVQENVDWGAPIGGQTSVFYDDLTLLHSRDVPTPNPQFFGHFRPIGFVGARMNAQKITRPGYPLCTEQNACFSWPAKNRPDAPVERRAVSHR
jgi:hypothetical protein